MSLVYVEGSVGKISTGVEKKRIQIGALFLWTAELLAATTIVI